MALAAMSSTSLTPPCPLHLQPQRLSSLSVNPIKLPKLKTPLPHFTFHSPLCHHFLQFRTSASASASDSFEDSESEYFEEDIEYKDWEEDDEKEEPSVAAEGSRLFVGNLPYAITSAELNDIFGEAGRVASVEIVYDVTDRSRGFAFVRMKTIDEAKEAIRMYNGAQVGGRSVKVNFPEVPRGGEREVMGPKIRSSYRGFIDSPYKIYAGNLSWNITSQALRDAFDNHDPGLLSAKVIYERDSGRSRGFGFVTFGSMKEAQSALDAMNGVEVEGRPLRLNLAGAIAATLESSNPQPQETKLESSGDSGNAVQSSVAVY